MRVFRTTPRGNVLIGYADVTMPNDGHLIVPRPADGGQVVFMIGVVPQLAADGGRTLERAVILAADQDPTLLPGWRTAEPGSDMPGKSSP